ncbi:MAG: hypothetical protein Q7S51_07760 [Gallionellaceae bacterium]|nr:hypothetical protein [Gallionellaceae bacterium]
MDTNEPLINERTAAQKMLIAATRRVGDALPPFSTWLMGGSGAALALVVANIETVSKFIEITHIRFGLIVFLLSLAVAVIATYISTIVKAALGAQEDGEVLGKKISSTTQQFDLLLYMTEYERGLFPPIRWMARSSMQKAMKGDVVASARMIAKLSQVQALLVACQSLLALLALGALAFGMKMQ